VLHFYGIKLTFLQIFVDEKISQPFHSSWQANTIDEKDIPLVEHGKQKTSILKLLY
jgi:hypothetical protein